MSHFEIHYDSRSQAEAAATAFTERAEGQLQVSRCGNRVRVTPPPLVTPLVALFGRLCRLGQGDNKDELCSADAMADHSAR